MEANVDFLRWTDGKVWVVWNDNYIDREDSVIQFIQLHKFQYRTPYLLLLKITERVNEIYNSEAWGPDDPYIDKSEVFLYYDSVECDSFYCTADDIIDYYLTSLAGALLFKKK
jgi:hypothetical protein